MPFVLQLTHECRRFHACHKPQSGRKTSISNTYSAITIQPLRNTSKAIPANTKAQTMTAPRRERGAGFAADEIARGRHTDDHAGRAGRAGQFDSRSAHSGGMSGNTLRVSRDSVMLIAKCAVGQANSSPRLSNGTPLQNQKGPFTMTGDRKGHRTNRCCPGQHPQPSRTYCEQRTDSVQRLGHCRSHV